MILIFDSITGTTEQIRHLKMPIYFSKKFNVQFTFRYASCRSLDLTKVSLYEFTNLFNEKMFDNNDNYISYHLIEKNITDVNCYDFYENHEIKKYLWKNEYSFYYKEKTLELIKLIESSSYEFIIVGPCLHCWYDDGNKPTSYLLDFKNEQLILSWKNKMNNDEETLPILPSEKIMKKFESFKNDISNKKYNLIHYRYENDYNGYFKENGKNYIVPTIDDLIEHVPFKEKLPIYIATSNIELLHEKKLLKYSLDIYKEIIYKKDCEDLMFDEAGFLDLLIGTNAEEVYGFSMSGLSSELILLKKNMLKNNRYDNLDIFQDEKYYKKI
jgi:hypothetical protein